MADPTTQPTKPSTPGGRKVRPKKRRGKGLFNFLLLVGIIVAIGLFVWAEQQRRDAESQLQQTRQELERIQESTQASGQAVADEVLTKIRTHMDIPQDPQPTVATIVDVDALRETSDFYQRAENGDHLIITETRAILYDSDRDLIIDVVPVQLEQQPAGEGEAPAGEPGQNPAGQAPAESPAPAGQAPDSEPAQPSDNPAQPQ